VKFLISCGISAERAVKMASENPARMLGLKKGRLAVGYDADMIVVDGDFNLIRAISRGKCEDTV
jgi:N-acetylglucosamine-6-phosphate deacetylase